MAATWITAPPKMIESVVVERSSSSGSGDHRRGDCEISGRDVNAGEAGGMKREMGGLGKGFLIDRQEVIFLHGTVLGLFRKACPIGIGQRSMHVGQILALGRTADIAVEQKINGHPGGHAKRQVL